MPKVSLDPASLLNAYVHGAFPMGDDDGKIRWYTADPRGVIPIDERFHVPSTLRALVRQGKFQIRINHDFEATMTACMEARPQTWINGQLIDAYAKLHELGFAHSVEAWHDGNLAGGLYGVSIGGAFFGESMFHRVRDASKVALVALVTRLREREFVLLDSQAITSHLSRFGAYEVPAGKYMTMLRDAVTLDRVFDQAAEP